MVLAPLLVGLHIEVVVLAVVLIFLIIEVIVEAVVIIFVIGVEVILGLVIIDDLLLGWRLLLAVSIVELLSFEGLGGLGVLIFIFFTLALLVRGVALTHF